MSLQTLKTRLQYGGGQIQEDRMGADKLVGLKRALLYSYQAQTAVLQDGREFRCLINDDKTNTDYTYKILSIPYRDICLNSQRLGKTSYGEEEIGIQCGDVFKWKETDTYWLVYMEYIEENAYFRAEICECEAETEINKHHYWLYIRGPVETTIQWNQKNNTVWNDSNYSLICYITQNEETLNYFHRFSKIEIDGKLWEVKTVNPYYGKGIIRLCLGEWFNNEMQDAQIKPELPEPPDEDSIYIEGALRVKPYDITTYNIHGAEGGEWIIDNRKARILEQTEEFARIEIMTGKSGEFTLSYSIEEESVCEEIITIESI